MVKSFLKWLASFFDESSPNSFSRIITVVIVAFVLGWDTSYLRQAHKLPDIATMAAQTAFMTAFYIARRTAGAYTDTHAGAPATQESNSGESGK